jgi:hypothetical protein
LRGLFYVVCATACVAARCWAQSSAEGSATGQPGRQAPTKGQFDLPALNLTYVGSFRVPKGAIGASSFKFGGTALSFNPVRASLFAVGHDRQQAIAEITIPKATKSESINDLPTAEVLQPFTRILPKLVDSKLKGNIKIGGLAVVGNQLIGTVYEYYDAAGDAVESHFRLSSLDLSDSKVSGPFQVGTLGAGLVAGYMGAIPLKWQKQLGGKYITGQAGIPITSRTSSGPAAFVFDPRQFLIAATPVTPLVYYPLAHPLSDHRAKSAIYNLTSDFNGIVFPEGGDELMFFGSHGIGEYWYGEADDHDPPDIYDTYKGNHAPPYVYQAWLYNVHHLMDVKRGVKRPWNVQPSRVVSFDLPFKEEKKRIGGVAYDQATARLFISQMLVDQVGSSGYPLIHVFKFVAAQSPRDSDSSR